MNQIKNDYSVSPRSIKDIGGFQWPRGLINHISNIKPKLTGFQPYSMIQGNKTLSHLGVNY